MDIDIDFQTSFDPADFFKGTKASIVTAGELRKHPAGFYLQPIPIDSITGLSAIPYKEAEDLGYFKIDFLHLSLLDDFGSKDEIRTLLNIEPDWSILEDPNIVKKLFQLHKHFDVIHIIQPRSVEDICDCVAIIRPGKKHLLKFYKENKEVIREELYKKPDDPDKYFFKKSHALAYAMNVVLQLHLIKAGII